MAINDYFFNAIYDSESGIYDRIYNANDFCGYLDKLVGNGVFPIPSNQLQVRASSGMEIIVNEGQGWINGHKLINTADLILTVSPSNALLDRIDRVIFYADETDREMGITILEGVPAVSPVAPPLTRNQTRFEMCLATITVRKGVTSISNSVINDTRANSNICGWVVGLVQQLDTSTLFTQWNSAYYEFMQSMESWKAAQQASFEAWLSTLTEELTVGAYVKTFTKIVQGGSGVSNVIPLDMEGYEYDSHDIFILNLNGLVLQPTYDYTLNTSGSVPTIELNAQLTADNRFEIMILKSVLGVPVEEDGDIIQYPTT